MNQSLIAQMMSSTTLPEDPREALQLRGIEDKINIMRHGFSLSTDSPKVLNTMQSIAKAMRLPIGQVKTLATNNLFEKRQVRDLSA